LQPENLSDKVKHYLQITDNRTGKKFEIKIKDSRESGYILASDILKIKD